MVELKDVSVTYSSGVDALHNVNLKINDGDFAFVVGASGAGKSTMIKLILKEINPTSGSIYVNGYNLNKLRRRRIPALRRTIGFVFQDFRLIPSMTVYENVAFVLRVIDAPTKYIRKRVPYVIGLVGLQDKTNAYPDELSGGEKTRVNLGRLILEDTDILLLDEPTNHLDLQATMWLEEYISKFRGTVLTISHDRYFLDRTVTRIIEIADGKAAFYSGNYSFYAVEKERRYQERMKQYLKEQAKIRQLEKALGSSLFVRSARGISLTAEGKILYEYVEKGYSAFLAGEKRLLQMQNLECGEITIGASDMTLRFFLLPYLERFHEKYPGVRFQITNGPTPATMGLLKEKKIDFGVVSGPLEKREGVHLMPVRKIEDIFVAGRNFLEYTRQKQPLSVLEKVPLIMLDQDTSTRRYVQRFLEQRKVFVHPEFELATSDMIVQFALRNLGVGSVVRDFAKKELDSRELIELKLEEQLPQREFFVVTEEKGSSSLAAQELLRMLSETAEENEGGDRI